MRELLALANERPPLFAPGTSFAYAHSGLVVLGEVLEKGATAPRTDPERILDPWRCATARSVLDTGRSTSPSTFLLRLHGYTNERGVFEDSSFRNPTAFLHSGNMTTTVADVATWFAPSPTGRLLTAAQHAEMMAPSTAGLRVADEGDFAYGVAHAGDWIFMNPAYGGYDERSSPTTRGRRTLAVSPSVTLGADVEDANTDNALRLGGDRHLLVPDRPPQV